MNSENGTQNILPCPADTALERHLLKVARTQNPGPGCLSRSCLYALLLCVREDDGERVWVRKKVCVCVWACACACVCVCVTSVLSGCVRACVCARVRVRAFASVHA